MKFEVLTINIAVELFGIIICMMVIFCRRFVVADKHREIQKDFTMLVLCEALLLFFSAASGIMTGHDSAAAKAFLPFCCFMQNLLTYTLLGFYADYIIHSVQSKHGKRIHTVTWIFIFVSTAALVYNLFRPVFYYIDGENIIRQSKLLILSQVPCILIFIGNLFHTIINRKTVSKQLFAFLIACMLIPLAALILQTFLFGIDLVNMALIITLMLMFVTMQNQFVNEYIEQRNRLQESNLRLMLSQVKPHFIFNSLTAIAQLCDENPPLARDTTISFAKYLRGNLSALEKTEAIPFEEELRHIRNYLDIETVRFGEYLKIVFDLETVDFKVPVLSIQPLVENAVKHGVGMKESGGTVTLSVHDDGEVITVKVIDDGVGFDPSEVESTEGHIGLSSGIERLKMLCNAEVTVKSEIGKGTEITVSLPKSTK